MSSVGLYLRSNARAFLEERVPPIGVFLISIGVSFVTLLVAYALF